MRVITAIALFAALAAALLMPTGAHAAFPGKNGRIVLVKSDFAGCEGTNLVTIETDGTSRHDFGCGTTQTDPAWSPDGKWIAGTDSTTANWSPDGTWIAITRANYGGALEGRLELRITDRDNTPHPGGPGAATVTDVAVLIPLPCAATPDPAKGSECSVYTTIDTLLPGAAKEGGKSVWELGPLEVRDGSGDRLLVQGLFAP